MDADGMSTPVTVLLPVKDGAPWLLAALDSLATQSQPPSEVVVVDDGSSDGSMDIVAGSNLRGLRVVTGPRAGLAAALSAGLAAASHDLVARLDQDDLAHPRRIETQARLLLERPEVLMCGSWALVHRPHRLTRQFRPPTVMSDIRRYLCLGNPFVHSSVMFRREAVEGVGGYRSPTQEPYPEDYDLWSRLAQSGELINVPQALVTYREHRRGVSTRSRALIGAAAVQIATTNFECFTGAPPSEAELMVLRAFHRVALEGDSFTTEDVRRLLTRLESAERPPSHRRVFPLSTRARLYVAAIRGTGRSHG
jgi:glycosyltransferase involved in cell wall biosynthesis